MHRPGLSDQLACVALPSLRMPAIAPITDPALRLLASPQLATHPADIKAAIERAGTSMAKLSRSLNVTQQTVYMVLRGKSRSQRVADAISVVLNTTAAALWPQLYGAGGK